MLDRRGVMFCVGIFLAARIALSLLGWLGIRDVTPGPVRPASVPEGTEVVEVPGPGRSAPATPGIHNAVDGTYRWDAVWFLLVAEDGYADESAAAFFPGYPLAIRIVDQLTPLGSLGAALLVSNVAFLAALLALYRLSVVEFDEATARRSVALLTFFPTSFFFFAPYSESMFLLASLLAFTWARANRWEIAGLAGAVALATRSIGATLVPALLLEAWMTVPRPRRRWLALIALPALVLVAYLGWWWVDAGDPLLPLGAQSEWHRDPTFPLVTLGRGVAIGLQAIGDTLWLPEAGEVVLTFVPLMLLAVGWRRLPSPSYTVYAALGILVPLTLTIPNRPLISMSRYVIVLFPLAWIAALQLDGRYRYTAVLFVSILGWIGLSLGFMNWRFVA